MGIIIIIIIPYLCLLNHQMLVYFVYFSPTNSVTAVKIEGRAVDQNLPSAAELVADYLNPA